MTIPRIPNQPAPRWLVILLGAAVLLFVLVLMDRLKSHDPVPDDKRTIAMPSGVASPHSARVLVLIFDSLRYETAMDAELMPNLAKLRAEGVSARVNSIYNAVTIPSIFTIFSGREDVSLLGFVRNFVSHPPQRTESIFRQLHEAGVNTAVVSNMEFHQFGVGTVTQLRRDVDRSPEWNVERMLEVTDGLARNECGLVVLHLPYTDHVAHAHGVGHPLYRKEFHWVDSLIPKFRAKLPPWAVLVVFGDHGHTPEGWHGNGMITPTACVYAGGPFRKGADLGTINLAGNRYLLNGAFGLPVPVDGYAGGIYPEAFVATEKMVPGATAEVLAPAARLSVVQSGGFIWLSFGVMVVVWLNLALAEWSPLRFRVWHHGLTLLGLAAAALPLAWVGPVALAMGAIVLALAARTDASGWRRLGWTVGLVLAAWALHGWGRLLGVTEAAQDALPLRAVALTWTVIGVAGAVAALRFNRVRWIWVGVAIPGLLLMPTHAFYGWTSLVVPVLFCWFVQRFASVAWDRHQAGRPLSARELVGCAALGAGIFVLAQGEAVSRSVNHIFLDWQPLIPGWEASNLLFMAGVGVMANFILLCPEPRFPSMRVLALILSVALYPLQWRLWAPPPALWAALLAGALAAGWIARRRNHAAARPLLVWFGLMLWLYLMRPAQPNHAALCCLLAALVLAARFMRFWPQPAAADADRALLVLLGAVVTGHALSRWSIMDLEWRAVYDWLSAPQAERFAALILVGLILKGLVPWWTMRRTVAWGEGETGRPALPARTRVAMILKIGALVMLLTGLGFAYNATQPYVEAAQQTAVFAILLLYVLSERSPVSPTPGLVQSTRTTPAAPHAGRGHPAP